MLHITSFLMSLLFLLKFNQGSIKETTGNRNKLYSVELTQSQNLARQEYVQKMCDLYEFRTTADQLTNDQMDHILVDHDHKLLYCYVPKVACTNWKRLLMVLTGQWNGTDVLHIPAHLAHSPGMFTKLGSLDTVARTKALEDYTRFIIVRHPFERLLSAYRNKLQGSSPSALYFQSRVGRQIIKNFRKNSSEESLLRGHDVTFKEFCEYIVAIDAIPRTETTTVQNPSKLVITNSNRTKSYSNYDGVRVANSDYNRVLINFNHNLNESVHVNNNKLNSSIVNSVKTVLNSTTRSPIGYTAIPNVGYNEHWEPASRLCHPCAIKYNVIGKYETLEDDSNLALSLIHAEGMLFPPSRPSSTAYHLQKHLQELPLPLLQNLYRVYKADFRLFGYGLEDLLGFELG